ncbi:GNAT family N-acetyltransferase [Thalassobius sp. Cn5-15]|uniref:GNAT family N-acetyltransferase n=1 Tax=Thalassobius sp. Cn5-15 TaxID=2917763 RepID=UPI001EF20026|nr:GNAT family N-acetyltransferase [Thalassobius sp. Cn5-15]MCG7494647.1 GNAT family N-acetyltransferase [Thalassobius sp. Cn5-15]
MRVRPFRTADAATLVQIFHRAVQATARADYSEDQLNAWSPAPAAPERYLARITRGGHKVWVAVDDTDTPIGFIELQEDGHIDCFYRDPDHRAAHVGQALYKTLEKEARTRRLTRLYVEASEVAKRFFLRHDFTTLERNEFERTGVMMHNTRMEKHLQ